MPHSIGTGSQRGPRLTPAGMDHVCRASREPRGAPPAACPARAIAFHSGRWPLVLCLVLVGLMFPSRASGSPAYMLDTYLSWESLSIGSGNPNSLRPGDPSGVGVGLLGTTKLLRGPRVYVPLDLGARSHFLSNDRRVGQSLVEAKLHALYVGGGFGLGVNITRAWGVEVSLDGDYGAWSRFSYHVETPGYLPISSEGAARGLHRAQLGLRGLYAIRPGFVAGIEVSTLLFGGYTWHNTGTKMDQTDTFTGYAIRLSLRYVLREPPLRVKRPDRGVKVSEGIWIKSESTRSGGARSAGAADGSAAKGATRGAPVPAGPGRPGVSPRPLPPGTAPRRSRPQGGGVRGATPAAPPTTAPRAAPSASQRTRPPAAARPADPGARNP